MRAQLYNFEVLQSSSSKKEICDCTWMFEIKTSGLLKAECVHKAYGDCVYIAVRFLAWQVMGPL